MPNKLIKSYGITPPLTMADRFRIICKVLELRYNNTWFDDKDLTYFAKVLLENGVVRISEEAYHLSNGGKDLWKKKALPNRSDYVDKMLKGLIQTDYLQVKIDRSKYAWEHMVPTKVLIDEVKSLYVSKKLTRKILSSIIDKYDTVCVVTKLEDKNLGKKLRSGMPAGWKFGDSALCRYDSIGIVLKQP